MPKFVMYNGDKLMQGSTAYELFHDPKDIKANRKALDAHMAEVNKAWRKYNGN